MQPPNSQCFDGAKVLQIIDMTKEKSGQTQLVKLLNIY